MRYSFDPAKRKSNLQKHGLDLTLARDVIESPLSMTFEDCRFLYDEERFITLGPLRGVLVVVVTSETDDHIRIISMRKADKHEQILFRKSQH